MLGVALAKEGELGCRITNYLCCHRDLRPHLTGDDLIEEWECRRDPLSAMFSSD